MLLAAIRPRAGQPHGHLARGRSRGWYGSVQRRRTRRRSRVRTVVRAYTGLENHFSDDDNSGDAAAPEACTCRWRQRRSDSDSVMATAVMVHDGDSDDDDG